jgi:glycosyltransferase involved in cell wall biosynthesis
MINKSDLNILHVCTTDNGGAWSAAYRFHKKLKESGYNSKVLVKFKTNQDSDISVFQEGFLDRIVESLRYRLLKSNRKSEKINTDYNFFNRNEKKPNYNTDKILESINFKPDVIVLHWVSSFLNTKNIFELKEKTGAKIYWYCLDMAPLTGGCHYAWDCEGYKKTCGECPALNSTTKMDQSYKNLQLNKKYIEKTDLTIITSTPWITNQVKESSLFKEKNIQEILISINPELFRPLDKKAARLILNIPENKKVILTGSSSLKEKRKGGKYFIEAINKLVSNMDEESRKNCFLLITGNDNSEFSNLPIDYKFTGYLKDDLTLALTYQAADVFVCTSIEDTGPMMINESIMCGTPVVSFKMGVTPKLVITGKTGHCAILKDSEDLSKGIRNILSLDKGQYNEMSENCRRLGMELLSPNYQIAQFEQLLENKNKF